MQGVCQNGLRVRLLPYSTVCRAGYCTRRSASSVYVWHKGGERVGEEKKKSAEEGKAWFLHSKWKDGCNNEAGEEWIKCIANVM